jgi:hypothetical protein
VLLLILINCRKADGKLSDYGLNGVANFI